MPFPEDYQTPTGVHAIPQDLLDLRPDSEIDQAILNPPPVTSPKNIWFFWNTGYTTMHPYAQRTVRSWHRRLTKHGWTIRVVDRVPDSPLHISVFVPLTTSSFPQAFIDGNLGGTYANQHYSDLVRWPLLLAHGGVYADVGLLLIGDLERLWSSTVGSSSSPYELLTFNAGPSSTSGFTNYFLGALPRNPFFARCHELFLALWAEHGGRSSTEGMRESTLLDGLPEWEGEFAPDVKASLEDYIAQGRVMNMVSQTAEQGWDGPAYVHERVYAPDYTVQSQLINEYTAWSGKRAFELMSLRLPESGENETRDQKAAREIVEGCLSRSFAFKLAHGLIIAVLGETLGSLWRANEGSDDVVGTYAHWLRYGMVNWTQDEVPENFAFEVFEPLRRREGTKWA